MIWQVWSRDCNIEKTIRNLGLVLLCITGRQAGYMRMFTEIYCLYFFIWDAPVDIIYCGNFMWTRLDGERSLCSGQFILSSVQCGHWPDHLIKSYNSTNVNPLPRTISPNISQGQLGPGMEGGGSTLEDRFGRLKWNNVVWSEVKYSGTTGQPGQPRETWRGTGSTGPQ